MSYSTELMTEEKLVQLFQIEEDHFNDFKAKDITGKKFSKIISAFANASGGDIYLGIREENETKIKHWEGFACIEDANSFIQVIESLPTVESYYDLDFLQHPTLKTYVLKICVFKTQGIVRTTDDKVFIRKGAQSLPVDTPEKLRRLELDKGITSFENEPVGESEIEDAVEPTRVLGEAIKPQPTLADTIVPQQSSISQSSVVTSLHSAISVGDRFMLIRDLFGGDEAQYNATIDTLESMDNLDDCIIYIAENFTWRASSDGAKLIMDLLQRKLS